MQTDDHGITYAIVNPVAGSGKAAHAWSRLSEQLRAAGVEHTSAYTQGRGDASTLARAALQRGVRRIIAVGGDGTLNEVANGFFDADGSPVAAGASLGVLPLGTGSDFARSLGIGAGAKAIQALARGTTRTIDVGRISSTHAGGERKTRIFLNVADAGIGADAAQRVNRSKHRFGPLSAYLAAATGAILAYQPAYMSLTIDDQPPIEQRASIIVVANMRYFGGGMQIAPQAQPDDGAFDLLWLGGATKRRLLLDLLPRVYAGTHIGHPQVQLRRATRVTIASDPPLPLEIDGEQWGTTPATFSLIAGALPIIVPDAP